jgi:hypothetical protein
MEAHGIIRLLGGASTVARDLDVGRSAVCMWSINGIPAKYWLFLARLAEAKGLSEITLDCLEHHDALRRPRNSVQVGSAEAA